MRLRRRFEPGRGDHPEGSVNVKSETLQHDSHGQEGVARNTGDYSISASPQAEFGAVDSALTCALSAGRSEDMSLPAPLAAIDALLSEKRQAREALDADIAALERSRELLAGVLFSSRLAGSVVGAAGAVAAGAVAGGAVAASASLPIAPGAWHEAALAVFIDGATHTTAEVYEAAKALVGPDLGYSAVASWLNRMAERGQLKKNGRGEFSLPPPPSREKTSEEGTAAA